MIPLEATFDVNASKIDSNFILRSHAIHSLLEPEHFDELMWAQMFKNLALSSVSTYFENNDV